ncbi:hypothetical protein HDE_00552 [Halotydeus destructor]|nr:hypothetical protein HDE_00552 [Halotydeus destructor]
MPAIYAIYGVAVLVLLLSFLFIQKKVTITLDGQPVDRTTIPGRLIHRTIDVVSNSVHRVCGPGAAGCVRDTMTTAAGRVRVRLRNNETFAPPIFDPSYSNHNAISGLTLNQSPQSGARVQANQSGATGQTATGQTAPGHTAPGQTVSGHTVSGQTVSAPTVSGQTVSATSTKSSSETYAPPIFDPSYSNHNAISGLTLNQSPQAGARFQANQSGATGQTSSKSSSPESKSETTYSPGLAAKLKSTVQRSPPLTRSRVMEASRMPSELKGQAGSNTSSLDSDSRPAPSLPAKNVSITLPKVAVVTKTKGTTPKLSLKNGVDDNESAGSVLSALSSGTSGSSKSPGTVPKVQPALKSKPAEESVLRKRR